VSEETLPSVVDRLSRDLRASGRTLGDSEARYIVDLYYRIQKLRIATGNQESAAERRNEPHALVSWVEDQMRRVEESLVIPMRNYAESTERGRWALSVRGIGPILAGACVAYIDFQKAKSASAVWRFCGQDPTAIWRKGEKRPYCARMKVVAWRIGDSFVKHGGYYGDIYRQRKALELERDAAGLNRDGAQRSLEERMIKDEDLRELYESGHFPAGRIDLRARRYAQKRFLAHYFEVGWEEVHKTPAPKPWVIAHGGHVHHEGPPGYVPLAQRAA
jgi:hypothetical protein